MQQLWMCHQYNLSICKELGLSCLEDECGVGFGFFFVSVVLGCFFNLQYVLPEE